MLFEKAKYTVMKGAPKADFIRPSKQVALRKIRVGIEINILLAKQLTNFVKGIFRRQKKLGQR